MNAARPPRVEQEREVLASRTIVTLAASVMLISVVAVVISSRLQRRDEWEARGAPAAERGPRERAPRVVGVVEQTLILAQEEGITGRRHDERELHHYGWTDRPGGIARIPIERAIDLYVAEHGVDAGARP